MAEQAAPPGGPTIKFGSFRLLPARHLLLDGDLPVVIGSRAMDILTVLAQRAGEVVSKDDLIAHVWPDTFVDETNLRVQLSSLRRALRDGRDGTRCIITVPGRGYSFVAPVVDEPSDGERASDLDGSTKHGSTAPLANVVGRHDVITRITSQLADCKFVTLVGPGGIGKTTVALGVAHVAGRSYRDGTAFVDLAPISNPRLVPGAIAASVGLTDSADNRLPALLAFLRSREMLLVLDNCEHVIGAVAEAAEAVWTNLPGVHLLATSREPLRAGGERVHRLEPLEVPSASTTITAAEAMTYSAIRLLVERTAAYADDFRLTDEEAPFAADICRRLDGIALAIELAASRVEAFELRDLAARLDQRLALLTTGRRAALPRHQTLAATLDWSYQLLTESERYLLRHLAVLVGDFPADAAAAVAAGLGEGQVAEGVANLVSKSMVAAILQGGTARYRLLDTTRLYGLEKLTESGELREARRRHAQHVHGLFASAEADCERLTKSEWHTRYGEQRDNARAALEWCFAEHGDAPLGVALAVATVPLWVQLSLMSECRDWAEQALAALGGETAHDADRMRLCAALGWSLMFAVGRAKETRAAWETVLRIAKERNEESHRLRALWGLWIGRLNDGDFAGALQSAQAFAQRVEGSSDSIDLVMADRLLGTSLHFLGDQLRARVHIEDAIRHYDLLERQRLVARFQFDQRVTARYFQARILWLLGYPDQARQIAEANIAEAKTIGHALSFASVLGQGVCPVALFTGDLVAANRYGQMLLDHAELHGLRLWRDWAWCFNRLLGARQGDVQALQETRSRLGHAGDVVALPRYLILIAELAARLGEAGEVGSAMRMVDDAIARCERARERWYEPELLRIKAELLVAMEGRSAAVAAEAILATALRLAKSQGARSWELRIATSLFRLRSGQARGGRAEKLLSSTLAWFAEGHDTVDLQLAAQALAGNMTRPDAGPS